MSSTRSKGVLITGASGGLGKATAVHLARRGYHVAATSRDLARMDGLLAEARSLSLPVSGYQLDINDPDAVGKVVPTILEQAGDLDGLVNNAGYGLWSCLEDLTKAMRMEVAQFGVRVVLVEPGLFHTNFSRNKVLGERARDPTSPYYDYTQRTKSSAEGRRGNDPERFGKAIEKILTSKHPKPRYQVGIDARLGNLASKLLPDAIIEYVVKRALAG